MDTRDYKSIKNLLPDSDRMDENFFYDRFAKKRPIFFSILITGSALISFSIASVWATFWRPPGEFPETYYFRVRDGMTLSEAASTLAEQNLIRSEFWFKAFGVLWGGERGLKAGNYYFGEPKSVSAMSWKLTHGNYDMTPIKLTIPEGSTNEEIAEKLASALPDFNAQLFLKKAKMYEGYLFPDTYHITPDLNEEKIIEIMTKNFEKRVRGIMDDISDFGRPVKDVVIMASLLEEEARTEDTRRKIAGILWKRISNGMLLQVDAVFPYILGKNTFEVTTEDLLFDSPYNTYKYKGLPPGPISNPGLESIKAAVTPIGTPYFYYLSDKGGNMYYAETHDGHLANRERYLGK